MSVNDISLTWLPLVNKVILNCDFWLGLVKWKSTDSVDHLRLMLIRSKIHAISIENIQFLHNKVLKWRKTDGSFRIVISCGFLIKGYTLQTCRTGFPLWIRSLFNYYLFGILKSHWKSLCVILRNTCFLSKYTWLFLWIYLTNMKSLKRTEWEREKNKKKENETNNFTTNLTTCRMWLFFASHSLDNKYFSFVRILMRWLLPDVSHSQADHIVNFYETNQTTTKKIHV